jgi:hypothetical protein
VNIGGPLATSLRAVRRAPVLVDDIGLAGRLTTVAASLLPIAGLAVDAEELARWTRAWLVTWQGVLHERGVIGDAAPESVAIALADVPSLKGDPAGQRRAAATLLLERAGVVRLSPDRRTATPTEAMFVPHRAGLELDWAAIGRAVRFEPAALLVVRALAELVVPPEEPSRVTLRELALRTGYAAKQVRVALRRLVGAGVLAESEAAGMPTQYRFQPGAIHRGGTVGRLGAPVAPVGSVAPAVDRGPVPTSPAPAASAERTVALRMTLNGVTVTLGAGLTPHVELGPDGIPQISFDPPAR